MSRTVYYIVQQHTKPQLIDFAKFTRHETVYLSDCGVYPQFRIRKWKTVDNFQSI